MDREKIAGITPEQIRAFRLRAHHLDRKLPPGALEAAGASPASGGRSCKKRVWPSR